MRIHRYARVRVREKFFLKHELNEPLPDQYALTTALEVYYGRYAQESFNLCLIFGP